MKGEKNGSFIAFVVKTTVEDISDKVKRIGEFCEKNNLNIKEKTLVMLSMEEMMMSIKDHCFEGEVDEVMDVRIFVDDEIILRIRNRGKLFNPIDYYESQEKEDELDFAMSDALGIEMISKAAKSVYYKSTFGINNLTVIIDREGAVA